LGGDHRSRLDCHVRRLARQGHSGEAIAALLGRTFELPPVNWWILLGGLAFATVSLALGVGKVAYAQEIVFLLSMTIVLFLIGQLTRELEQGSGTLPFLGPNCYGMVNFFDRVALWPDQVVGDSPERGVALISQSGTIALTLMFNDRSLPIGYLITVGNQTRLAAEDLIDTLCDDPRVSAFGLYLEGIKDTAKFTRAVDKARARGKPVAVVKSGRTETASRTARRAEFGRSAWPSVVA
jgi:succinyl-CoA synthetase alpha subunit